MSFVEKTLGCAVLVGALFAPLFVAGCSPYPSLCEAEMDCEGGNDADIDACVVVYEAQEDVADTYDCGDFYDDYIACFDERARCSGDSFDANNDCNSERDRWSDCVNDRR